jgi:hypothetical protein
MTPWNELTVINYESLQTLTASDVYEMFQGTGLTHMLVIENHGDESAVASGLPPTTARPTTSGSTTPIFGMRTVCPSATQMAITRS